MPHTFSGGSTATWAATVTEYDILGRVSHQSVPTEVDGSWNPTGDDYTRGWLWTFQKYDWMGRTNGVRLAILRFTGLVDKIARLMARRTRIEVEGGLYHIITRGVDRQDIFHDEADYARFMKLLLVIKERRPSSRSIVSRDLRHIAG